MSGTPAGRTSDRGRQPRSDPPSSQYTLKAQCEQYILACAASDSAARAYAVTRLKPEDFSPRCRPVWERLVRGERVETASAPAPDMEKLAAAVRMLRACRSLEDLERLIVRAQRDLENGARSSPERFLRRFVREVQLLAVPGRADAYVMGPAEWLERGLEEIRRAAESGPAHFHLGLAQLTQAVLPERGHLVILAGETGRGKTAFALNVAVNLGIRQGIPTLYLNTEMSWRELVFRIYALLGAGSLTDLRLGRADPERAACAKAGAAGAALWVTDALPWGEVGEVLSLAAAYRQIAGIEVLVVDYVQRLEDRAGDMEQWEVFLRAARSLKSLAQQQEMLVVMVAQLNDRGQLAGSRGMAREADAFLVLEEASDAEGSETHYVVVRKSRHTPAGRRIPVVFDEQTLFVAEVEE